MMAKASRILAAFLAFLLASPLGAQNPSQPAVPQQNAPITPPLSTGPSTAPLPESGGRIAQVSYGVGFLGAYQPGGVSAFDPRNSPQTTLDLPRMTCMTSPDCRRDRGRHFGNRCDPEGGSRGQIFRRGRNRRGALLTFRRRILRSVDGNDRAWSGGIGL